MHETNGTDPRIRGHPRDSRAANQQREREAENGVAHAAYCAMGGFLAVTKLSARHTFIIDPQGGIARVFADVKPSVHSREVLAALDALGATGK